MSMATREALVEDVEWLLAAREWSPRIATRLGYTQPRYLARQLRRLGRHDLANRIDEHYNERRCAS